MLENIKTGITFQEYCKSCREVNPHPEKGYKEQQLELAGTTRLQAKISRCKILEEDVFLVEISIKEI